MRSDQLRYFQLTYECGSYSAAARRAFLTPQGVAKAVRSLEGELGYPLFYEHSGRLVPTEYADEVYRFSVAHADESIRLQQRLETMRLNLKPTVRVGVSLGIMGILGLDFFSKFEDNNPGYRVKFEEQIDNACDEGLALGNYDLAFCVAPYSPEFITRKLCVMGMSMWVNRENALVKKGRVDIEDLSDNFLAIPGYGFKNFARLQRMCGERGVTPKGIYQSHQMYWIYDFVLANKGIGTNVDSMLRSPTFQNPNVVSLPFEDFSYQFGLSRRKGHTFSHEEEVFLDYVESACFKLNNKYHSS